MNTDQFRKLFPDESACRAFFESIIWRNGRFCPHCGYETVPDSALVTWVRKLISRWTAAA